MDEDPRRDVSSQQAARKGHCTVVNLPRASPVQAVRMEYGRAIEAAMCERCASPPGGICWPERGTWPNQHS